MGHYACDMRPEWFEPDPPKKEKRTRQQLKAELEFARALLKEDAMLMRRWVKISIEGGWSTNHVAEQRTRAKSLTKLLKGNL